MLRETGGSILPEELRGVPSKVLEDYVNRRIIKLAGEQVFANRLYTSEDASTAAAEIALSELRPSSHAVAGGQKQLKLVFRHTCLAPGCRDSKCNLCRQTQHRRCLRDLSPKYLAKDPIKAKCGADIFVEVMDQATSNIVGEDQLSELHLEVCILEGNTPPGTAAGLEAENALEARKLLVTAQGHKLLEPGVNSELSANNHVLTRFSKGRAALDFSVLASSIAMLHDQKGQFQLLVRAVTSQTIGASFVGPAVSDAFVIATQRVKGAQKADIPHVDEGVGKIEAVGKQTQDKLQDIQAAAKSIGLKELNIVPNSITTVGQFRELVESCGKDVLRQKTLRKVLGFTAVTWEAARTHVLKAVSTDNRMRIWCANDTLSTGLLFCCEMGRIDLSRPVGLLYKTGPKHDGDSRQVEMEAFSMPNHNFDFVEELQQQATKCWWQPRHPGWSVFPTDSKEFIRMMTKNPHWGPMKILAAIPACSHSSQSGSAEGRGSKADDSNMLTGLGQGGSISTDSHSHAESRPASEPMRFEPSLKPQPLAAPRMIPAQAYHQEMETNWNNSNPPGIGQAMRQNNPELSESVFIVPSTASPASGSSHLGHLDELGSFSSWPSHGSNCLLDSGMPTVALSQPDQQSMRDEMEMMEMVLDEGTGMATSDPGHFPPAS